MDDILTRFWRQKSYPVLCLRYSYKCLARAYVLCLELYDDTFKYLDGCLWLDFKALMGQVCGVCLTCMWLTRWCMYTYLRQEVCCILIQYNKKRSPTHRLSKSWSVIDTNTHWISISCLIDHKRLLLYTEDKSKRGNTHGNQLRFPYQKYLYTAISVIYDVRWLVYQIFLWEGEEVVIIVF